MTTHDMNMLQNSPTLYDKQLARGIEDPVVEKESYP
jgi:hypothetical protein